MFISSYDVIVQMHVDLVRFDHVTCLHAIIDMEIEISVSPIPNACMILVQLCSLL